MIALVVIALLGQEKPAPASPDPATPDPVSAPAPAPAPEAAPAPAEAAPEVKANLPSTAPELPLRACANWKAPALMEGPVVIGYAEGDLTLGRRACPRSEVGIGADFGAIIDTPNFYGDVGVQALLYGSWAINEKTEVFAMLEALDFQYTVNAVISGTRTTLGNATLGLSRQIYETERFAGALTGRVLLPTASNIPGTRNTGAEIGHSVSARLLSFLEVHAYAGVGFTIGLGPAPLPAIHAAGMIGAALTPVSWFSFVIDVSGGLAGRTFFAPSAALRFRVFNVGIELAVTRPLAGTDRNDVIGALRIAYRL